MSLSNDQNISDGENPQSNFFLRLFRGDISLPITYWVFGVGTGIVFRFVNFLIEKNFIQIVMHDQGIALIKGYNIFAILISLFLSIAIWRSANKYDQSPGWALVAKIMVIIRLLVIVMTIYNQYFIDTELALKNEILLTNNNLPMMADEQTRFDRMSLDKGNIYYHYTLMDIDKSEVDLNYFIVKMHTSLAEVSCKDEATFGLLKDGRKLIFDYKDKNNDNITDITVEFYDCN